jgi:hypothetical protein
MRIGTISAIAAAIAVASLASSVSAQEFSLSASPTITGGNITFTGASVNLQQTTSINCAISATLAVAGGAGSNSGPLNSPSISPGNPFCGLLVFPVTPWSGQTIAGQTIPSGPGSATVTVNVGANTIANDPCNPQPVQATLTTPASGPSTLTFNNVVLQAASGRPDRVCRINGVLTATGTNNRLFIH